MRDLMNTIHPVVAIAPQVATDATALVSGSIDLQGYNGASFLIALGTLAATAVDATVVVKEGDTATQGDHTAVADVDLVGTEALAGFDQDADSEARKIGYMGGKRYISIEITPTSNDANLPIAALALLGHPLDAPTSNPPA